MKYVRMELNSTFSPWLPFSPFAPFSPWKKIKKGKDPRLLLFFFEVVVIYERFGGEQKSPTALHLQVTFAA